MSEKCFYCTNDIQESGIHQVTFHVTNEHRDETLCNECYQEWLHGIKE